MEKFQEVVALRILILGTEEMHALMTMEPLLLVNQCIQLRFACLGHKLAKSSSQRL